MTAFERGVVQENIESPQPIFVFNDTSLGSTFDIVKSSGGTLFWAQIDNSLNSVPVFLQLFDNASPTVGTTAGDEIIAAPAGIFQAFHQIGLSTFSYVAIPGSSVTTITYLTSANPGKVFSTAITAAVTTSLIGANSPASPVSVTICYQ